MKPQTTKAIGFLGMFSCLLLVQSNDARALECGGEDLADGSGIAWYSDYATPENASAAAMSTATDEAWSNASQISCDPGCDKSVDTYPNGNSYQGYGTGPFSSGPYPAVQAFYSLMVRCNQTSGCTDPNANNYNPLAVNDDGSCDYGSPPQSYPGCTNSQATNYNPNATEDDGSCIFDVLGCTNSQASNFNPSATVDDGSCIIFGCTSVGAANYNPEANTDDGSCNWGD